MPKSKAVILILLFFAAQFLTQPSHFGTKKGPGAQPAWRSTRGKSLYHKLMVHLVAWSLLMRCLGRFGIGVNLRWRLLRKLKAQLG